jgi:small subunit ribosomal protein S6
MAFYECVLLIKSQLSDEEAAAVLDRFQKQVDQLGGTVHHVQKLGKKRLSYELKKERRADYVILYLELKNTTDVAEIDRLARLDERVIKSMIVRKDKLVLPASSAASEERGGEPAKSGEGEAV